VLRITQSCTPNVNDASRSVGVADDKRLNLDATNDLAGTVCRYFRGYKCSSGTSRIGRCWELDQEGIVLYIVMHPEV
jgi:hypothetical protein